MKKRLIPIISLFVLMAGLLFIITVGANNGKNLTKQEETAQVLLETKKALNALKADKSNATAVSALERSIKKLEQLNNSLDNSQSVQPKKQDHALLQDDFFSSPFDEKEWNPLQEMQAMQNRMNQLFGEAFGRFDKSANFNHLFNEKGFSPNINLVEEGEQFVVTVDLPGAGKDDVEIILKDQLLTIKGSIIESKESKDEQGRIVKRERMSGNFSRAITLPAPVKSDGMVSKINDGILEIRIPKT